MVMMMTHGGGGDDDDEIIVLVCAGSALLQGWLLTMDVTHDSPDTDMTAHIPVVTLQHYQCNYYNSDCFY